jgi:D-alanyl-lipoteichoic acid acyltransferase DltB (MBOAT superfamily)
MFFQTWTFALFFAVVWPVYLAVHRTRLRVLWLLAASYVFYASFSPVYVVWLVLATTVDWLAVLGMSKSRLKAPWLVLSLAVDLGMLGSFKYFGPAAGWLSSHVAAGLNLALGQLGTGWAVSDPGAVLPIGMSFYVFQSLTYTIGCYRGQVEREPSFLRYAAYVAMFPQLLMGPIERAGNLLPELGRTPKITPQDVADGLSLFVVGLFKKVVLADGLALYVDPVYASPGKFEPPALMLATFAFAWQIYFDFSGYTDMARGVGRALGFRIMLNFNNPYLATGLGDFWRRWHISLSTWFRDFVYIPLGGNRRGPVRTYVNMFVTMVISGLWHGSTWNFALWGALHGLGRVATRHQEESPRYKDRVPRAVKTLWVFLFVSVAWVFFRAKTLDDAWMILGRITRFAVSDLRVPLALAGLVLAAWLCQAVYESPLPGALRLVVRIGIPVLVTIGIVRLPLLGLVLAVWVYQAMYESRLRGMLQLAPVRIAIMVLLILGVVLFAPSGVRPFIYSQF